MSSVYAALIFALGVFAPTSFASSPAFFTIQGKIFQANGSAEESAAVDFRVQVLSPDGNLCVLYDEARVLDLTASGGLFTLPVGDGNGTQNAPTNYSLAQAVSNLNSFTIASSYCGSGNPTTYAPGATDGRKIIVYFKESMATTWENLPTMNLTYSPLAMQATQVGGFGPSSLVRVQDGTTPGSVTPLTTANYNSLLSLATGSYLSSGGGTMTGAIIGEVGTKTAPSYAFTGDASTGIFDSSTGVIGISAGGNTAMTISNGAVSIAAGEGLTMSSGTGQFTQTYTGSSNAASITANSLGSGSSALSVASSSNALGTVYGITSSLTGSATTNIAGYFSSLNATNNYGLIVGNGLVGIGTTAPQGMLDTIGPTVAGASSQVAYFRSSPSMTGGFSNNIWLDNLDGASDEMNQVVFSSQGTAKWSIGNDLNHNGQQNFFINDNVASSTRFFINSTGYVGIGTTNPTALLDTNDTAAQTASYTGVYHAVANTSSTASINKIGMDIESTGTWNGAGATNTGLLVNVSGGTTNYAAAFLGGNVGVGTATPAATLDVKGHIANSGSAASVGTCGTSPAISGNDTKGIVTLGTGSPTACTVTFATSFATAPYCVITAYGGLPGAIQWYVTTSTTALVMNFSASPTASQQFSYHCIQ